MADEIKRINIRFKQLRDYISTIDKISVCDYDSLSYDNYACMEKVSTKYDNYYVYGIGIIQSEFENKEGKVEYCDCLEIMVRRCKKIDENTGEYINIGPVWKKESK